MSFFTAWSLRLLGISGILGALFFISGDLSYNHIHGSTASPAAKMSVLPEQRLINAGILGLFGCGLYVLATLQLYLAFYPVGSIFAFVLSFLFSTVMISYGISHAAYFSIAAGARAAVAAGADAETGAKLGTTFFQNLVNITYIPVASSSLMMIYGILFGRSLYPRWMVLFLPIVIYLLKTPIVRLLRGQLREIVNDAYDNIVLLVFFVISTIVLWNVGMA
jgi:hypothetical protein